MSFLQIPIGTNPNTFLGYEALRSVVITPGSGILNTAFGFNALKSLVSGSRNTAIGNIALRDNQTGDDNTAVGNQVMRIANNAFGNVGVGHQAFYSLTTGSFNVGIGWLSLFGLTTGGNNTAIGQGSGRAITTGSDNSILGGFSGNQGGLDIRTLSNYIVLSDGAGNPRLWIDNTGAVNIPGGFVLPGGTANGVLYLNGSKVVTSGSALTFDGTNLGLGVVPSAWNTGALQIGNASLWGFSGSPTFASLGSNYYYDGSYRYISANQAADYYQYLGQHIWRTASAGTAGNGISFTQAMTLDASGNLGIGTTSTTSGRLTVDSNSGIPSLLLTNSSTGNPYLSFQSGGFIQDLSGGSLRIRAATALGYIDFDTNATRRFRIDDFGNSIFGTAAIATNATNGFVYVPTCAGTPTGTPTTYTGTAPIVVDTTNNKLYFYSGGAWRDAGP